MATINILTAVDGATLAQQVQDGSLSAGSQSNPTNLGSYSQSNVYITMTAQSATVGNNTQGSSELQVNANSGDTLRWTIQTFDSNMDYTAYLYNGAFNPPTPISQLVYLPISATCYLPSTSLSTAPPAAVTNTTYATQGTITQSGQKIQYTLSFALVNNQSGAIVGYFSWDPFIQVSGA